MQTLMYLFLIIACAGLMIVHLHQHYLIKRQTKTITNLLESNELLTEYCLGKILKDAIETEDYATAERCRIMIAKLKELAIKSET